MLSERVDYKKTVAAICATVTIFYIFETWSRNYVLPVAYTVVQTPQRKRFTFPVKRTAHVDVFDLWKDSDKAMDCVALKTEPSTPVCIYPDHRDQYISHDLRHTGLWEPVMLKELQAILLRDQSIALLDIGANIGVYSLLAAKMGHIAIAVEPFAENVHHIHKSAILGKLRRHLLVLQNGVSNERGMATVHNSGDNQGDTRLVKGAIPCVGSCLQTVKTILMDDLLEVIPNDVTRVIIKIDIQGFEHKAFAQSEKLFKTKFIPYIFMEWFELGNHYVANNHSSLDKDMVGNLVKYLWDKNYRPYSLEQGKELEARYWYKWPFDIVWCLIKATHYSESDLRTFFKVSV